MKGLREITVLPDIAVVAGTVERITMHARCTIFNPSDVGINMGTVEFTMVHDDQPVGSMELPHCVIQPGLNHIEAVARFHPGERGSERIAGRHLLSQYIAGLPSVIRILGSLDSCRRSETGGGRYLAPAVAALDIETVLPGMAEPLLKESILYLLQTNPITFNAPAALVMINPFDVAITVVSINGGVRLSSSGGAAGDAAVAALVNTELGTINEILQRPWIMSPRAPFTTPVVGMRVRLGMATLSAVLKMATAVLRVDVEAVLVCRIGAYETVVNYQQMSVPVIVG